MTLIVNKIDELPIGITLVSVVRNVEETYEMCLRQAGRICDEILIVNQSSTDNTEQICKRVLNDFNNKGKFVGYTTKEQTGLGESHRQFLVDKARFKWIMLLDGDEYWSDQLLEFIHFYFIHQTEYDELRPQRVTIIPGLKPQIEKGIAPRLWRKEGTFCPIELNAQLKGTTNPLTRNDLIISHLQFDKETLLKKYDSYDLYNENDFKNGNVSKEKYLQDKMIIQHARERVLGRR